MAELRVSVVVPTRNRPARLASLLESLREQTVPTERFEVIVVDDGGEPAVCEPLLAAPARSGLNVRLLRGEVRRGPAAARNRGWRAAGAPLIAFTDDDCTASARWLEAALEAAAEHPGAVIQGRTLPDPSEAGELGLLSRTVTVEALGPQYETCNIVYPRAVLESLGGFDERFGSGPAAEDTDLAWRAIEAGLETVFAPEALVLHAVQRLGVRGTLRLARRWEAAIRIFADHPQTRVMLYRGAFWNIWHYLLWRTVLSLLGPAWLRRILVARYLRELRARGARAGAGPWAVPFLIAHDAIECVSVARGAIRHRTLVL